MEHALTLAKLRSSLVATRRTQLDHDARDAQASGVASVSQAPEVLDLLQAVLYQETQARCLLLRQSSRHNQ